jgi:hypothetical protein
MTDSTPDAPKNTKLTPDTEQMQKCSNSTPVAQELRNNDGFEK